jgi:UDP:flavonoid glycosyltransferase YjiC (YdhE family)
MIYSAFHGEPYDESHQEVVISIIKENSDIVFPDKMESLKAADRIAPGVGPGYVCLIVRFETDKDGFTQLRDSLSKQDSYIETLDYNSNEYIPFHFSTERDIPQWFKIDIAKDIIYYSFGITKNNAITLHTTCVRSEDPDKIVVYMEGLGDPSLRKELNSR